MLPQRNEQVCAGRAEGKSGGVKNLVEMCSDVMLHLKIGLAHGRQMEIYNIFYMATLEVKGQIAIWGGGGGEGCGNDEDIYSDSENSDEIQPAQNYITESLTATVSGKRPPIKKTKKICILEKWLLWKPKSG